MYMKNSFFVFRRQTNMSEYNIHVILYNFIVYTYNWHATCVLQDRTHVKEYASNISPSICFHADEFSSL